MTRKLVGAAWPYVRLGGSAVLFAGVAGLLMLWLVGYFHPKIGPGMSDNLSPAANPPPHVVAVRSVRVPRVESAVGTISPVHETAIGAKLLARVAEINVAAGQAVKAGDVLVHLDDADLAARLRQTQATLVAAEANRDQARVEVRRVRELHEKQQAAKIELDRVETAMRTADAEVQRAEQTREEAATTLAYATIASPIDGVVVDRLVEAGDTVTPGQTLLKLFDPTRMQLVASVRESLTQRLRLGQTIPVHIDALDMTCDGTIREIVPEAQAASRSFIVKVAGPCPPGAYSGMFGRLLIPLDEEELIVVPRSAARRIGQLDVVELVEGGRAARRVVQLGRAVGDDVEVLSGLSPGEQIATSQPAGQSP